MTSLIGSFMFAFFISLCVTNCRVVGDEEESRDVHHFDPNLRRLRDLATLGLRHVETERTKRHALHELLGFEKLYESKDLSEYVLLVQIGPTNCDKNFIGKNCGINTARLFMCQIHYWVKEPKMVNPTWPPTVGPADPRIIANNCTHSQIFPDIVTLPPWYPQKNKTPQKPREHRSVGYFGAIWKHIVAF